MGKGWNQFWCLHRWKKGFFVGAQYGKGYLCEYHCTVCEKMCYRWTGNEPISGMMPVDEWLEFKKDPLHRMSPPIIKIDD